VVCVVEEKEATVDFRDFAAACNSLRLMCHLVVRPRSLEYNCERSVQHTSGEICRRPRVRWFVYEAAFLSETPRYSQEVNIYFISRIYFWEMEIIQKCKTQDRVGIRRSYSLHVQ